MTMKSARGEIVNQRLNQILLLVGPATTLFVNPWSNFDPISVPKMLILSSAALPVLALILMNWEYFEEKIPKAALYLSAAFVVWMIIVLFVNRAPLNQQFWGSFGRNTGFLSYFSLLVIMLGAIAVAAGNFYAKLIEVFINSSFLMTAYCLIQEFGTDPIPWSEKHTFGTLGNVNFLSAYLGMVVVACAVAVMDGALSLFRRTSLFIFAVIDFALIISTGSIQGPIIALAGIAILFLLKMRELPRFGRLIQVSWLLVVSLFTFLSAIALFNKGPLAKWIFQPSVIFRSDYMHAGWEMTLRNPLFGVGMDSYGDWYRTLRGSISTLRTGPDRISNTAHNIFLDISSNGGAVLGVVYVSLILYTLLLCFRVISKVTKLPSVFLTIFVVWVSYQIQSMISINQLGVGVWGWIFTGSLIGLSKLTLEEASFVAGKKIAQSNKDGTRRTAHKYVLSARDSVTSFVALGVGFLMGIIPVVADTEYRKAAMTGDVQNIWQSARKLGSTEFHREMALDSAMRRNSPLLKSIAEDLVKDYPRSFYGWRVLSVVKESTDSERSFALARARELDPFNPTVQP